MLADHQPVLAAQIGPVRLLTLNRPGKLNTFNAGMLAAFDAALDDALLDAEVRVIVITGSGKRAFTAGNDVEGLAGLDPIGAYRAMMAGQKVFMKLNDLAKPAIAMVNGYALGGGFELALACDFIIAADTARFGFPEITLNTMPGWGGTQFAVARLGIARAKSMVMTGRLASAGECREFGIVEQVVKPDALLDTVLEFASTLAVHDGFALEMAKRSLNRAAELPLGAGFDFEAAHYAVNFGSAAARAGLDAFLARRAVRKSAATPSPLPTQG
jgi:enoyl-CoA hydratase/carnithine racemase